MGFCGMDGGPHGEDGLNNGEIVCFGYAASQPSGHKKRRQKLRTRPGEKGGNLAQAIPDSECGVGAKLIFTLGSKARSVCCMSLCG